MMDGPNIMGRNPTAMWYGGVWFVLVYVTGALFFEQADAVTVLWFAIAFFLGAKP